MATIGLARLTPPARMMTVTSSSAPAHPNVTLHQTGDRLIARFARFLWIRPQVSLGVRPLSTLV
jgi:hypothetical protein